MQMGSVGLGLLGLSAKRASHGFDSDHNSYQKGHDDTQLCNQILQADPLMRAAAILEGTQITGFASTPATRNQSVANPELRDKMGFWQRTVIEIGRQMESYFGGVETISYRFGKLTLVALPISKTRSIGLSMEKTANTESVLDRIQTRIDRNGPQNR
jgi:hypothetical protein